MRFAKGQTGRFSGERKAAGSQLVVQSLDLLSSLCLPPPPVDLRTTTTDSLSATLERTTAPAVSLQMSFKSPFGEMNKII